LIQSLGGIEDRRNPRVQMQLESLVPSELTSCERFYKARGMCSRHHLDPLEWHRGLGEEARGYRWNLVRKGGRAGNRKRWLKGGLNMNQSALLIVDMLKDFFIPDRKLSVTRVDEIISRNRKVIRKARKVAIPIIFVNDNFQKTEIPLDRHFRVSSVVHAVEGTDGAKIIDELEYDPERDFIVGKKIYDGFYNTRLDSVLRELNVRKCVITGVKTNACVQHTAMGAWFRCYDVVILKDCCASSEERDHEYALKYMKRYYLAEVMDSDTWISKLEVE